MYICSEINGKGKVYNLKYMSMIKESLTFIEEYLLTNYQGFKEDKWTVRLGAINKEEQPEEFGVLISLIHIEEERNVKAQGLQYYHKESGELASKNPEIVLNLYILVSSQSKDYKTALTYISQVIGIFQANNTFGNKEIYKKEKKDGIQKLTLDLHPLTFEQNNSLWQTLGATMTPSVIYKVRTIVIQESKEETPDIVQEAKMKLFLKKEKWSEKEEEIWLKDEEKKIEKDINKNNN